MFWLTPVIYHWTMVPKPIEIFVKYNPLAMLLGSVQVLLHGGIAPTPTFWWRPTSSPSWPRLWASDGAPDRQQADLCAVMA